MCTDPPPVKIRNSASCLHRTFCARSRRRLLLRGAGREPSEAAFGADGGGWRRPTGGGSWTGRIKGVRAKRRFWRSLPAPPRCKLCLRPFARAGWRRHAHDWAGTVGEEPEILPRLLPGHRRAPRRRRGRAVHAVRRCSRLDRYRRGDEPAELLEIAQPLLRGCCRPARRPGGHRRQVRADEVVGLFVPGMAGLDHAARAIDAARSLLVATGHGSTGGSWIPVGVGVHTGVAFVGSVGDRGVTDFTALGDAVNTAARVASMAGPGETLVTRAAAEAARLGGGGNGGTSSCADGLSPSTPWCFERERRRPNPDRGRAWLCPVTPGRRSSWA